MNKFIFYAEVCIIFAEKYKIMEIKIQSLDQIHEAARRFVEAMGDKIGRAHV